jgi:hypothetical protein
MAALGEQLPESLTLELRPRRFAVPMLAEVPPGCSNPRLGVPTDYFSANVFTSSD